jgi:hypothetical protein
VELVQRLALESRGLRSRANMKNVAHNMLSTAKHYRIVPRHGETGNALSEVLTFSVGHWLRHFRSQGLRVTHHRPLGLFYTGHMVLGARMPPRARVALARVLGTACHAYKVAYPPRAQE